MSGFPKLLNHLQSIFALLPNKGGFLVVLTFLMIFLGGSVVGQRVSITSIQSPGPTAANPFSIDIKFEDGVDILNLSDFIVNNGIIQDLVREVPYFENLENGDLTYFRVNPSSFELISNFSRINEYFKEKLARAIIAIDVDSNNNIYYLTFADGVYKYNPSGIDQLIINKDKFQTPLDLVMSSSNQIIVADKDAYKVRVFKNDGSFSYDIGGFIGKDGNEFYGPTGLAINENNILYVADAYTGNTQNIPDQVKIYKVLENGSNFIDRYNSSNGVVIQDPYRIAVDKIGNVFLSDSGGNSDLGRVLIFNSQKELIETIEGGPQGAPGDLIIDDYGYLYVIDFGEDLTFNDIFENPIVLANNFNTIKNKNYFINVYDKDYNYLTRFNQNLNLPIDLALDNCGYLYVNDSDLNGEINLPSLKVDATFDFKLRKFKRKDNFSANIVPSSAGFVEVKIENQSLFKCGPQPSGQFSIFYQPDEPNTSPVTVNDAYSTLQNTTLNIPAAGVLSNDNDSENDPLTARLATNVSNGTLTLNPNGSFSYIPNPGYFGPDSFTYFANDGKVDSNSATVTIMVTFVPPVNKAPVAVNDSYTTPQNTTLNIIPAAGVLSNDTDSENDPLTARLLANVSNGTLILNPNGSFIYVPNSGFTGDDTFNYVANDGKVDSNSATVTITVTFVPPVNTAPVAVNDSYSTLQSTTLNIPSPGVLANDTDADNDPLTAQLLTNVLNGTLTLNPNGSFIYVPNLGYFGPDSFIYFANDGVEDSNTATVTITVTATPPPSNSAPVANNNFYEIQQDGILVVDAPGILGNDTDANGDYLTASVGSVSGSGSFEFNGDGSFKYTPLPGFFGTISFTYVANDGQLDSNIATVTINVIGSSPSDYLCKDELILQLDETGSAILQASDLYTGDPGDRQFTLSKSSFDCTNIGDNQVVLNFTGNDGSGTCGINVIVEDRISPVVRTKNITIFLSQTGQVQLSAFLFDDGSSDNCGPITLSIDKNSLSCQDLGQNVVTITATDASGNTASLSAIVTVTGSCEEIPETGFEYISIYPNPTPGPFTFDTPNGWSIEKVEVFDARGRYVLTETYSENEFEYSMDLSSLQQAVYILKLYTSKGIKIIRVIIY